MTSAADPLRQCRRNSKCRAMLPESSLERDQFGKLVCLAGHCPNGKGKQSEQVLTLELELRRAKGQLREYRAGQERALSRAALLQERLDAALEIRDIPQPAPITASNGRARSTSVPVFCCTDWHCGAKVDPASINDLNTYNVDIFHERVDCLFPNALRVINMARSTSQISSMVLFLGGDLIDNWLHPEQIQLQEISPIQQIIECERAIVRSLDFLLASSDMERIVVVCCHGNHGRTTPKMQADNSHATSYEWMMYQSLQRHYRKEARLEWIIADGYAAYHEVLGQNLRFHHGDAIRYGGGIGGITIPLQKWIHRTNQGIRADHTFQGHLHTLTMGPDWSVNGSLIGATAYGMKMGFAPERPQQLMKFIDSERGFTLSAPILTD